MKVKPRIFSLNFILIIISIFSASYALFGLNATTTLYIDSLGSGTSVSGVLNVCFTISACVARLIGGYATDRLSRRSVMMAGSVILSFSCAMYMFVSEIPALMFFRAVQGIGYAAVSISATTALIDILPPSRLGEGIGISSIGSTLGNSISPAIGIALAGSLGFKSVFLTLAAVSLIALFSGLLCRYEKAPGYEKPKFEKKPFSAPELLAGLFEKSALAPALIQTVIQIGMAASYVYMSLFAMKQGYVNPGLYFTLSAVFALASRIFGGRFADRENAMPAMCVGLATAAGSFFLLTTRDSNILYYICGAAFGLGSGVVVPIMNRQAVIGVEQSRRGAASATFYISADLGAGLGGIIWGLLIENHGFKNCFLLTGIWLLFALVLSGVYFWTSQKKKLKGA